MSKPKNKALFIFLSFSFTLLITFFSIEKNIGFLEKISSNTPGFPWEFIIFVSFTTLVTLILFLEKNISKETFSKIFLFFLPAGTVFILEGFLGGKLPIGIYLLSEIYFFTFGIFTFYQKKDLWVNISQFPKNDKSSIGYFQKILNWFSKQGKSTIFILIFVFAANLSLGLYHMEKFAAVDEPLWLFGRISKYWEGISQGNLDKTFVSDKPGITASIISGAGLLWDNPMRYEPIIFQGKFFPGAKSEYEKLFFHFRFPILLFSSMSLFLLYFFLEKTFGKNTSILGIIFIGLSPILVGMSTIINPDSLLWIFTSLSIFSYFSYLKEKKPSLLVFSGVFLGLSLLTKYVANIIFIFFLGIIFLEYIFKKDSFKNLSFKKYLRLSFLDYFFVSFYALLTFWLLCPATWMQPRFFIEATILSQAFRPILPAFILLLFAIFADILFFKNKFLEKIMDFLSKNNEMLKKICLGIFVISILLVIINTYSGMKLIDFEVFLSSPKSAFKNDWKFLPLKTFLSNFYPLIFAISPIALLSVIGGIFLSLKGNIQKKTGGESFLFYLLFFILLYYIGSSVTGVASVIRYQIILFPITLVVSAFFLDLIFKKHFFSKKMPSSLGSFFLIFFLSFSMFQIAPLYSGYASFLLPKKYFLDVKDMGSGSYEAAEFLNSLPEPKKINIWTDKSGVCYFFKGNCYTGFSTPDITPNDLDYLVLSSGRESRTVKMSKSIKTSLVDFGKYYSREDLVKYKLEIDNRPEQYIKIINLKK